MKRSVCPIIRPQLQHVVRWFAAECRAGVSDAEWMNTLFTRKASVPGAAGAGHSPAVVLQNRSQHGAQQQMRAVSHLQLM